MAARRRLTSDDITQMRWLSAVACRPGGDMAGLVETSLDPVSGALRSRLLLVDARSGDPRSAPVSDVATHRPAWDPAGRFIAFVAGRQGARRLFVWDVLDPIAVPHPVRTLEDVQVAGAPSWSPDGERIVCPVESLGTQQPARPGTDEPLRLVRTDVYKQDGQRIGLSPQLGWLRIFSLAGDRDIDITSPAGNDSECTWSPDGTNIAFVSDRQHPRGSGLPPALWLVPAHGGQPRRLTSGEGLVRAPVWAPDGRALAYIGNSRAANRAQNQTLRVLHLNEGTVRVLTDQLDVSVGTCVQSDDTRGYGDARLCWPAGDRGILCSFPRRGRLPLTWINPGQPPPRELDSLATVADGRRVALSFDTSADGSVVMFVASDITTPGELHVASGDGSAERPITTRNRPWSDVVDLAEVRHVTATTTDGITAEAWLYLPAAASPLEAGSPRPLVLAIHGGPHWPCGWRFSFEYQRLAALGYAVAVANPRGSQGYGEAFAQATQRDWGHLDVDDELAVLDALAQHPEVDQHRTVVTGVSYGGYLSCLLVATTDRFAAAIVENGVTDLTSYFGTTADGGRFASAELGTPWDNPSVFRERSPLTFAEAIRAPLLLVHGELDQDCPLGQSEQMYTTLRQLGRPVELAILPGEGHLMVINGTLPHRLQRWAAIDDFLARHVPISDATRDGGAVERPTAAAG